MEDAITSQEIQDVQARIERMDELLAQGRKAMARMDAFFEQNGIDPGVGEQVLTGEDVPDRHRVIFARLIAELSRIDQRIDEFDTRKAPAGRLGVGARAVGNRYRI